MNWSVNHSTLSWVAFGVLVVLHLVGLKGLNSLQHEYFEAVAWVNLLLSFAVVVAFHRPLGAKLLSFCLLVFILGLAAEIVGVTTGQPFGQYHYTDKFGLQLMAVPLIIGINWVLLTYVCGAMAHQFVSRSWLAIPFAALCMVVIDLLLEPFAIRHGFWVWANGRPPLQNYGGWFMVGVCAQLIYWFFVSSSTSANAVRYVILLVVFLAMDLLLGKS